MPTKVIYVHGMGGSPEDWRRVQARQPGLSIPLDSSAENPAACASLLAEAVISQASASFALCGYSMGGRIALLAAAELIARRRKPDALILVSAGFGFASPEERTERIRRDHEWADLLERSPSEFWEKWYAQELFSSFQRLSESTRTAWLETRNSLDIKHIIAQLRHLGPGQHEDLFPLLRVLATKGLRVLYLVGELDKKYSELTEKVREIPGVTVNVIPEAGHILPLEAPEALALRISKFVK